MYRRHAGIAASAASSEALCGDSVPVFGLLLVSCCALLFIVVDVGPTGLSLAHLTSDARPDVR